MPNPGDPTTLPTSPEDAFLELLAEILDGLDAVARGQFLRRFFKTVAQVDLTEEASVEYWERILQRSRQFADALGEPASLKAVMAFVLASSNQVRLPMLIEYAEVKKLQINAATDPLTSLHNRRFFEEHFDKELDRALRYNHHLALVLIDLHQFKQVNDRYGHQRGDLLLQTAANTFRKSLRTSDYAFRIGGDEFALLLVQSDTEQATTLARRLQSNFQLAIEPMRMTGAIGLDYGVAVCPLDGNEREDLIRTADERLYEAKGLARPTATQPYTRPTRRPATLPGSAPSSGSASTAAPPTPASPPESQQTASAPHANEKRKSQRTLLAPGRAYAHIAVTASGEENRQHTIRMLDVSVGGVALEGDISEDFGPILNVVLHVPVLPPLAVTLKKLYQICTPSGHTRIGCAFIT